MPPPLTLVALHGRGYAREVSALARRLAVR